MANEPERRLVRTVPGFGSRSKMAGKIPALHGKHFVFVCESVVIKRLGTPMYMLNALKLLVDGGQDAHHT